MFHLDHGQQSERSLETGRGLESPDVNSSAILPLARAQTQAFRSIEVTLDAVDIGTDPVGHVCVG